MTIVSERKPRLRSSEIEMELKYRIRPGSNVAGVIADLDGLREFFIESTDTFYWNSLRSEEFLRYRRGLVDGEEVHELTLKRKLKDGNRTRIEVNLPLDTDVSEPAVRSFATQLGYENSSSLDKKSTVFSSRDVELATYDVYSKGGKFLGSFLEVELKRKKTLAELARWEKRLSKLGLDPSFRELNSLFELFGRTYVR